MLCLRLDMTCKPKVRTDGAGGRSSPPTNRGLSQWVGGGCMDAVEVSKD